MERKHAGVLFNVKLAVWGEGVLSSPATDSQRIYPDTEIAFGSRTKQLGGETRAWGPAGGDQMAGCARGPFAVFQG